MERGRGRKFYFPVFIVYCRCWCCICFRVHCVILYYLLNFICFLDLSNFISFRKLIVALFHFLLKKSSGDQVRVFCFLLAFFCCFGVCVYVCFSLWVFFFCFLVYFVVIVVFLFCFVLFRFFFFFGGWCCFFFFVFCCLLLMRFVEPFYRCMSVLFSTSHSFWSFYRSYRAVVKNPWKFWCLWINFSKWSIRKNTFQTI